MVILTQSLEFWLTVYHPEILHLLYLGHVELFTEEMKEEYIEWLKTDEGRKYLKGGDEYRNDERNRIVESFLEQKK